MDITLQISKKIHQLRISQGLSIEALADRTGVSKSSISLIERGESNPTATVLDKLATGLGVVLASLFEAPADDGAKSPVCRANQQTQWTDPGSGYRRCNLSPSTHSALQLVDVHFPAGQRVTYETGTRDVNFDEQIWMIDGEMQITVGHEQWHLKKGDCLAVRLNQPVTYHNPGHRAARYLVAITRLST